MTNTNADYEFVDKIFNKYGHDDSILDCSELDGFLTALVCGLDTVKPSEWISVLWGGKDKDPEWDSEDEFQRFFETCINMMNFNAHMLIDDPDNFCALFKEKNIDGEILNVVESWCFGFMRGVDLRKSWQLMPAELMTQLDAIALHGRRENLERRKQMSKEEYIVSTGKIEPAVRALHAFWLEKRASNSMSSASNKTMTNEGPRVGRNDPCPCGSGKKFKKCCLH